MKTPSRKKRMERWRSLVVIVVVSMAIFLDTVDVSIVNVALPDLQRGLQLTTTQLQWVPGIYGLTYAGFMLLGGRAADLLGRRRIFFVGAALLAPQSRATRGWLLIVARGVQGIGAALTMPAATSILTTTFPEGEERNKALGIFSATGGAGFTCGLVLGGLLTNFVGWHWVFLVNVPFVLLILVLSRLLVPEGRHVQEDSPSSDIAGAITVTAGLLLLVYATTTANGSGTTLLSTGGLLGLALVLLALFFIIEWRSRTPLVPLHIFRSRNLSTACVVSFTLLGSFFGFLFIYTLYLQEVLHFTSFQASLVLLPASIASVLTSQFVAPWLMNRFGLKATVSLGMFCLLSGIALFLRTGATSDYVGIILPSTLLTQAFGMALCIPSLPVAAVTSIKQTEQGLAAGLQGTSLQAGGGIFVALTATIVTISTQSTSLMAVPSEEVQLQGLHRGLLVGVPGPVFRFPLALATPLAYGLTPKKTSRILLSSCTARPIW
jgi:EmrB/QacA subfamily drug resistance transporter